MDTLLLLTSASLVGLWVLASAFGIEVIRHFEGRFDARRTADGRLHLVAPSHWQSVAA